jgi:hypothetical protein
MPRDSAIIFDLIGKLDVLRVEYPKCGRAGWYRLRDAGGGRAKSRVRLNRLNPAHEKSMHYPWSRICHAAK